VRNAIGCAVQTLYILLIVAGSSDIIAQKLSQPIDRVVWALRILLVVLPVLVALFTWRMAHDLREGSRRRGGTVRGFTGRDALTSASPEPTAAAVAVGRTAGALSLLAAALAGIRDAFRRKDERRR
jgi:hypothetical protein